MKIAITGSTGMVGQALTQRLEAAGHQVVPVLRPQTSDTTDAPGTAAWDPAAGWIAEGALDGCDAVVNLAGASIAKGRWTANRKRVLRESRIKSTRLLVNHMAALPNGPRALISASAIGYYGDRGEERLAEDAGRGSGFLADLSVEWEQEALAAEQHGIRVATPRFGVILSTEDGALPRMLLPIKMFAGGPLGSGKQWMPWITLDDVTRGLEFLVTHEVRGAFNFTAPQETRNKEVIKAIASELGRPAFFPTPGFGLKLALGQMAGELLLTSARVVPDRLQAEGFTFAHPTLDTALPVVLGKKQAPVAAA